jgi:hypothetical protein
MAEPAHRGTVIRTMKTDADELLQKEKASFLDLFTKEEQARREKMAKPQVPKLTVGTAANSGQSNVWKGIAIVLIVLILMAVAGSIVYFVLGRDGQPPPVGGNEPTIPTPQSAFLRTVQESSVISVRPDDRTGVLTGFETIPIANAYTYAPIFIESRGFMTTRDFFETLRINPPSQDFYNGVGNRIDLYKFGRDAVFIIEVTDKDKTQGNMLAWESQLHKQIVPTFRGVAIQQAQFSDRLISNVDARVARGEGDLALGYSIVRGQFLVITTSESLLKVTIERLLAQ